MEKKVYSTLIVDDSAADRKWCRIMLEKSGRFEHIYDARTGHEALALFLEYEQSRKAHGDAFPPVLIMLDINMPGMDGFEFLDEFRLLKDEVFEKGKRPVVVLMVTSSNSPEDKARAKEYGFVNDFISKSLTEETILKIADTYGTAE